MALAYDWADREKAEFIYDPTVRQFIIDGVHDVTVRGNNCEIFPLSYRKTDSGLYIKTHEHTCVTEIWNLPGMAVTVLRKAGFAQLSAKIEFLTESAMRGLRLH